jgi:hypothetical protein
MPSMIAVESGDLGYSRGAEKGVSNTRFVPTLRQLHVYVKCEIYSTCTILSEPRIVVAWHRYRSWKHFTVSGGGACALDLLSASL